ncbi:MAG: hypothetical protein CMJ64_20500 [Planctomycetaceae bacterium]|nr:hypothetical protein [Planctomycetaceae bacterium]
MSLPFAILEWLLKQKKWSYSVHHWKKKTAVDLASAELVSSKQRLCTKRHGDYCQANTDGHNCQQDAGHSAPGAGILVQLLFTRLLAERVCLSGMAPFHSVHVRSPR